MFKVDPYSYGPTCPKADIGSTVELSFNSSRLEATVTEPNDPPLLGAENDRVPRKGESYVKDFKPLRLGTITLTNVVVVNSRPTNNTPQFGPVTLPPGQSMTFTGIYLVPITNNACTISHTLTATGRDACLGSTVTHTAIATCLFNTPRLTLTKMCPPTNAVPGSLLMFSGTVTNTGTISITNIMVVNNQPGPNTPVNPAIIPILQPGQGTTFTGSYPVPTNVCSVSDTLRVINARDVCGTMVSATNNSTCVLSNNVPAIGTQPTNKFAVQGSAVAYSVTACGKPPLSYQWRKNSVVMAGKTSATLTLNSVGPSDSGGYTVVVSNAHGSALSATASLAVLTDGANGNQPLQPIYPVLPPSEMGKDSLVFITHGRTPSGDSGEHPWVDDMETAIKDQASPNWMVLGYKWDDIPPDPGTGVPNGSRTGIFAVLANARDVGRKVGRDLMELAQLTPNHKWEHVHLIAHSAGSRLIEEASKIIDAESPTTTIHTTFLDAYTGVTDTGRSKYGSASDWADSYFAVDTDTYDKAVGRSEGPLERARNTDITWLDQNVRLIPIPCPSSTAGSTPPVLDRICSYDATSFHRWPYEFYLETILGTASSCATGYGFPRSKEGGRWDDRASYPVGNSPTNLCGSPPIIQNPSLLRFNQPLQINLLPSATSSSGVNRFGNSFTLTSTPSSPAPQQNTKQDGPIFLNGAPTPNASGQPVWLAVGVTVTNVVNFVQFEATFSTTNAAEGLMAVYWNTNQIGTVDERVGEPTLETYRFGLPDIVTNGLYTLSFRLDVFTNTSSTITVTNVTTGFAGLDQPISLDVLLGSNSVPVLKLTGTSNFTYLVESSTNLLNWSPAALISNTNGTVLFTDPSATNSNQRFYRATTP